ncbi:MAG TPA: hypothetical protein VFA06_07845 [Actinocrinis sp.]|uniref:hypothetical protein n=1 Tax=Actinocrinis sp. TaxID=1920516 RepID=UPI002D4FEFDA|nr:hypothetical protein [Actinocrinis sp.]HZU55764.1 hypothetical protein [Actinocrinis sp.]
MLVVGLLLLAAAVAVGAAGVAANTGTEHQLSNGFTLFGYHLHGSAGRLYLAGLVIGAVAMLGFMMVAEGLRRDAALRRELGRFRRDARARRRRAAAAEAGRTAPAATAPVAATVSAKTAEPVAARTADGSVDTSAERSARRRGLRNWRTARPAS